MAREPIQPWEFQLPNEFLIEKFGKAYPAQSELDLWREAETAAFVSSPLFSMRGYLTIDNKRGDFQMLDPWACQYALHIAIESQRVRGLKQQIVEIKPRQIGYTTYLLARGLWKAMHPNQKVSIMVIEEKVADELSKKLATMYNNLPVHMKPMKRIDNLKFVIFDNPNSIDRAANPGLNSSIFIGVPSSQRGRTPHMVVASEYAYWDEELQDEFMTGLVGPMAMNDASCVVIDTTPNGHDDGYEPLVQKAIKNNPRWVKSWEKHGMVTVEDIRAGKLGEPDHPERGFIPVFWPWYWHEEYTTKDEHVRGELPRLSDKQRKELLAAIGKDEQYGKEDERDLFKRGVTLPRLWWRRRKMDSYENSDSRKRILTFRQEFASDWQSCFVDYELSPFDPLALDAIQKQVQPSCYRGILRRDDKGIYLDQQWNSDYEEIRVYAAPKHGEFYCIGVDTQIAYESAESDATVAQVVRVRDHKVVATYTARVPQYRLREQLKFIYDWYNQAYYAIETQGIGYGLVRECMEMGMHNTYYWKRLDKDFPEESHYPGWQTDARSRPIMEQAIIELIECKDPAGNYVPAIIIPDKQTVDELVSVKRDPTGKIKASSHAHDDHVDALMICCAIMNDPFFPYPRDGKARKKSQKLEMNALIKNFGMTDGRQRLADTSWKDL